MMHKAQNLYVYAAILLSVFMMLVMAYTYFSQSRFSINALLFVGNNFHASRYWRDVPRYVSGYDGQFVYYIAHNPFDISYLSQVLDVPAHRYKRILYPLLVWVLAMGGKHSYLPWIMIGINMVCISLVTIAMVKFFPQKKRIGVLLCAFIPSFYFSLKYSTPELLGVAFMLWGVLCYSRKRVPEMCLSFIASGLTKEFYIITPLVICVYELFMSFKEKRDMKVLVGLFISIVLTEVWVCWNFYIFRFAHFNGQDLLINHFSIPFYNIIVYLNELIRQGHWDNVVFIRGQVIFILHVMLILGIFISSSVAMIKRNFHIEVFLGFAYSLLSLSYGEFIYDAKSGPESFVRVSEVAYIFGVLSVYRYGKNSRIFVSTLLLSLFICSVLYLFTMNDIHCFYCR